MVQAKTKKNIVPVKTQGNLRGYSVGTTMYYASQTPKGWNLIVSTPVTEKIVSKHKALSSAIKKAKSMAKKIL